MSDSRSIRKLQRINERRGGRGRDGGDDAIVEFDAASRGGSDYGDDEDQSGRRRGRRTRAGEGEGSSRERRAQTDVAAGETDYQRYGSADLDPDAAYGDRPVDRYRRDLEPGEGRSVEVPSDRPVEVADDDYDNRDLDLSREGGYQVAATPMQEQQRLAAEASYARGSGNALTISSLLIIVVIPTLLTALFYIFIATNQYSTISQLSIRTASGTTSSLGSSSMLGGMSAFPGTEILDSFVVLDYINSRDMIAELEKKIDLRAIYDRPEADFYYRFDPTKPIEDFVEYLRMMIIPEYNTLSNVITLTVRAFRPADAQLVAENVIAASERLVNDLSRRSRDDALREARAEVARAEQRLRLTRTAIASFRGNEVDIDPEGSATAQQAVISNLETQIANTRAQLNAILPTMSEKSPRVIQMRGQIDALEKQVLAERQKVAQQAGTGLNTALSERLTKYEELLTEREFAEQTYVSALGSLEGARMQADRQQRYVSVFVTPRLPEEPLYPEGLRWTAAIFGLTMLIWGVFCIMVAGVRDNFV